MAKIRPRITPKIPKQDAEKMLANVVEEYVFWCCDGRVLRSMQELKEALKTMTDETFAYHANAEKNDFANWVRDIIKDEKLAEDLRKLLNRKTAATRVAARVGFLIRTSAL